MKCPFCNHAETQVIDSRASEEGDVIRRRRRCNACERRFTTYERVELALPAVVKRDGTREDFNGGKLRASMSLALRKRAVSAEALDDAVDRIAERLRVSGLREIPSDRVGGMAMDELKRLDQVAYVRFASVYRSFQDIEEFIQVIDEIQEPPVEPGDAP